MTAPSAVLRRADPEDVEGIVDLQVAVHGVDTEWAVRRLCADYGTDIFTVAVDAGRVVSALCLLPETFCLEGTKFTVGQPEYVATDPDFRGLGLVRAQMEMVHAWSARRGNLAQVVSGIPYFYRQFGYEYAVEFPRVHLVLPGVILAMPKGYRVRKAVVADVAEMLTLQELAQREAPLIAVRDRVGWIRGIEGPGAEVLVAEDERGLVATAAVTEGPPGVAGVWMLRAVAGRSRGGIRALLAEVASMGRPVAVQSRRGTLVEETLAGITTWHPHRYGLGVRVPDPVAFLDAIRPVLSARLERSSRAGASGHLLLSLYRSSVVIHYQSGAVTGVEAAPGEQDPPGRGGAGVPPDLIATLLFGRYGATALAGRHDDVAYADPPLMEVLFPRLLADLQLS